MRKGLIVLLSTATLAGFFGGGYLLGQKSNDIASAQNLEQSPELKSAYDALYQALQGQDNDYMLNDISRADNLEKTQKEWRDYITQKCETEGLVLAYGGTMSAQITEGCLEGATENKIKELKNLLKLSQ